MPFRCVSAPPPGFPHAAWHAPPEQESPAPQVFPHAPQCAAFEPVSISQPSAALLLQSWNELLHEYTHVLPAQEVVALATAAQAFPHAPQWAKFEDVLISQPSTALLLQFANGALQAKAQAPALQEALELFGTGQTLPHAPQFVMLVEGLISQPSAGLLLQSLRGALQTKVQEPPAHTLVAPLAPGQTLPQAPQFIGSFEGFTQAFPHCVEPPAQPIPQAPPEQVWPAAQALPQAPQWVGSFWRSTQRFPHFVEPPAHVREHWPAEQI